jgi:hypothetical protein
MRIYTNRRAWRLRALLALFAGIAAAGLVALGHGLVLEREGSLVLGGILAPIGAIAFGLLEWFAHNYVTALDLDLKQRLTVFTMSLFGDRQRRFSGAASLGAEVHPRDADVDRSPLLGTLKELAETFGDGEGAAFGAGGTAWRPLRLPGRPKPYMIDTTGDANAGTALAAALAAAAPKGRKEVDFDTGRIA